MMTEKQARISPILGPPMIVALGGALGAGLLHVLPCEALDILVGWIVASVPLGMLIGHCSLND
jgi:hypothetical protein